MSFPTNCCVKLNKVIVKFLSVIVKTPAQQKPNYNLTYRVSKKRGNKMMTFLNLYFLKKSRILLPCIFRRVERSTNLYDRN